MVTIGTRPFVLMVLVRCVVVLDHLRQETVGAEAVYLSRRY